MSPSLPLVLIEVKCIVTRLTVPHLSYLLDSELRLLALVKYKLYHYIFTTPTNVNFSKRDTRRPLSAGAALFVISERAVSAFRDFS